jgi:hypothetical protein
MRELIMVEDRSQLQLERNVWSSTGFKHVIKVGQKFQARLQVPGDGRGGLKKRRQHALPGLFDNAEDAAVMLAMIKRSFTFSSEGDGNGCTPHRSRTRRTKAALSKPAKPCVPAQLAFGPVQSPVATTMAVPVPFWVQNAPVVAVTALPMCSPFALPSAQALQRTVAFGMDNGEDKSLMYICVHLSSS